MYLISCKVPQIKIINCLYAIYLTSTLLTIGEVLCIESKAESYTNHIKKVPISGSGSGATTANSLQKRSSYQVISQTMSEAIGNNEFGSGDGV
ncbi:hypothetical protein PVAND_014100 [Polypedilum vanderplanki]|uniref:Uncharacterized protein n=1 Tax=Polypedilum vanderplanki TaxID=319348 RepID=A0A9J6CRB7_POLVA|nr:hypothetical protein PVAND_014100 [Polypedilum vanderplanki]